MQTGALAAVSTRRSKRPHAVAPVSNAAEIPHRPPFRCAALGNEPGKQPKCAAPRMTDQHPERPDRPAPHAAPKGRAEDPFSERCTACKPAHWRRSARGVCHFLKNRALPANCFFQARLRPAACFFAGKQARPAVTHPEALSYVRKEKRSFLLLKFGQE